MSDIDSYITTCRVCGTVFDANNVEEDDVCPYCGWMNNYDFEESDDFYSDANLMTLQQAKDLLSKGLNIFGEPLPKR